MSRKWIFLGVVLVGVPAIKSVLGVAAGGRAPETGGDLMPAEKRPSQAELRQALTPEQYYVTQEQGTEPPFQNAYWQNHTPGIYVDVVSGEPLFSSLDKFDSGTGWPSFTRPLAPGNIVRREDTSLGVARIEVRSRQADSHLGHVFNDGPGPTHLRYCINSAAVRFVSAAELTAQGYGELASLFPGVGQAKPAVEHRATAVLAGGCFWGVQDIVRKIPGVIETEVGYTGGSVSGPSYEDVKTGRTGHAEAVRVVFDPTRLGYAQLLGYFFRLHDPTTPNRQGNDVGSQYRSVVFYADEQQRQIAEKVRADVNQSGKWNRPVVTEIVPAQTFYRAEDYHQDYLVKHPGGYSCHFLRD